MGLEFKVLDRLGILLLSFLIFARGFILAAEILFCYSRRQAIEDLDRRTSRWSRAR